MEEISHWELVKRIIGPLKEESSAYVILRLAVNLELFI
jgi:hypothetical protein